MERALLRVSGDDQTGTEHHAAATWTSFGLFGERGREDDAMQKQRVGEDGLGIIHMGKKKKKKRKWILCDCGYDVDVVAVVVVVAIEDVVLVEIVFCCVMLCGCLSV